MRRLLSIFLFCLAAIAANARGGLCCEPADSSRYAELDAKLEIFLGAIHSEPISAQCEDADFIIESCNEEDTRQRVALKVYGHYVSSPLMGLEAVAIHVYDNWFASGKVKMLSDMDLMNARIFADFNRLSLIGLPAPSLNLKDAGGQCRELPLDAKGYKMLYFYDAHCKSCELQTPLLAAMLRNNVYASDTRLYCIYTGDNASDWEAYREKFNGLPMPCEHYWDPEMDSAFQVKYGILQTPRLFLIGPGGTIVGRNLESNSLRTLLNSELGILEYGSSESGEFYSAVLEELSGGNVQASDIRLLAENLQSRTLDAGDTLSFRQMTGDLFYHISTKHSKGYNEGTQYLIENQILGRGDVWNRGDDSLKVTGLAESLQALYALSPVGSRLPSIKLRAEIWEGGEHKVKNVNLSRLKGENTVAFVSRGCHSCDDLRGKIAQGGKWVVVEMEDQKEKIQVRLLSSFDLSVFPYVMKTATDHTVADRYL